MLQVNVKDLAATASSPTSSSPTASCSPTSPAVEAFVAIAERADLGALPNGCDSLAAWLARARAVLPPVIHGTPPGGPPERA